MIVTLDGQRIAAEFGTATTLQGVIDEVRAGQPRERIVVGVAINGQECGDTELATKLGAPLTGANQIDLESMDAGALAATALRTVAQQLGELGPRQPDVARALNGGQVADAVTQVGAFVRAWQTVQTVILQVTSLTGRDLLSITYESQPVQTHINTLLERLRELRAALDARDMVSLADLLHYEAPPLCAQWRGLLEHMADVLAQGSSGSC